MLDHNSRSALGKNILFTDNHSFSSEVMTLGKVGFESSGVYKKPEALRSPLFAGLSIKLSDVF